VKRTSTRFASLRRGKNSKLIDVKPRTRSFHKEIKGKKKRGLGRYLWAAENPWRPSLSGTVSFTIGKGTLEVGAFGTEKGRMGMGWGEVQSCVWVRVGGSRFGVAVKRGESRQGVWGGFGELGQRAPNNTRTITMQKTRGVEIRKKKGSTVRTKSGNGQPEAVAVGKDFFFLLGGVGCVWFSGGSDCKRPAHKKTKTVNTRRREVVYVKNGEGGKTLEKESHRKHSQEKNQSMDFSVLHYDLC